MSLSRLLRNEAPQIGGPTARWRAVFDDMAMEGRLRVASGVERAADATWLRTGDFRRWAAHCLRMAGVAAALGILSLLALAAYPYVGGEARWMHLQTLDDCTRSVTVYDARGWLGRIPAAMLPSAAGAPNRCQEIRAAGWRAHSTGYVADPPDEWWAMLVAAEDRRHGTWGSVHCVDVPALAAVGLGLLRGRQDRGGSTLAMQLSRSMRGRAARPGEGAVAKARRKLTELADAAVLCRGLGGAHSPEFRRWVARHLPCVHGTASSRLGGSVYSIEDCARVVFGKELDETDLAEQAILVAAARRHVLFAPADDGEGQRRARERWVRIQGRALRALELFTEDDPAATTARAKVAGMELPTPKIAPALRRLLPEDPVRRVGVVANPERRVTYFAHGEVKEALGEVLDAYGELPRDLVSVELTPDAADNAAFKRNVEKGLDEIDRRDRVLLDLPPPSRSTAPRADVTLSLADGKGHVLRHYSAGHDRLWSGANGKRGADWRYRPDSEDRAIGSVAKILAALLIGARFQTTDTLCNRRVDGLRNPDGSRGFRSCRAPEARVAPPVAFAKSMNLPVTWALAQEPPQDIAKLVGNAGLQLPRDVAPRIAVAFGMVAGGTRALHRLAAAVSRGARGREASAVLPTLIKTLVFRDDDGQVRRLSFDEIRDRGQIYLSARFRSPEVGPFVAEVLGAPARRGGTLAGLNRIVRAAGGAHLIAKSGTTTTTDEKIRDQLVAGSFVDRTGDQKTFHLLIGSPDPAVPLSGPGGVPRTERLQLIEALLGGVG